MAKFKLLNILEPKIITRDSLYVSIFEVVKTEYLKV